MSTQRSIVSLTIVLVTLGGVAAGEAATRARPLAESVLGDASVRLAAGDSHTCQVNGDGTVRCWGLNNDGQLGDGTTTNRVTPVTVSGLTNAVAVADGGFRHSCALLADGRVLCWGSNFSSELGDGTTNTKRLTPVPVIGITSAVALAATSNSTCALLVDGAVLCWGGNAFGELGDGTRTERLTPVPVTGVTSAVAITAGFHQACALLANGTARCWGNNDSGELGDGTRTDRLTPVPVSGLTRAVALAGGLLHTCALLADGGAQCWGFNGQGQLGNGDTTRQLTPVGVSGLTGAVALTAGDTHTCALLASGSARCWGDNAKGQLGDGTTTRRLTPVSVNGLTNAVAMAAGHVHTCAVPAGGSARCWGGNSSGQLGNGTKVSSPTPSAVGGPVFTASAGAAGAESVTGRDVAVGGLHTCAVRANSTVACWGFNHVGQLGDGTTATRLTPVPVSGLTNVVSLTAGFFHTCALLADGTARCWGDNGVGKLGDGTTATRLTPVPVSGLSNAVALSAGIEHTCALLADGTVRCWGFNATGQLGTGDTIARLAPPTPVIGLAGAVALAAGGFGHTCALVTGGGARCWGSNDVGQLGDGTTTNRLTAVPVSGLTEAVALAAGGGLGHTCALRADGTARCWGDNSLGQLGDGTTTRRSLPRTVFGLTNAVGLATGADYTCAIVATGGARCWGDNAAGQLGDGTTTPRLSPTIVTTTISSLIPFAVSLGGATHIAAGGSHTCAVIANGGLRCWGENEFGQIGDGTTTDRRRAVTVPSFTLNIDPVVALEGRTGVALVTIIAACEDGQRLDVEVRLTQGALSGHGVGDGECTGRLEAYPVAVQALGDDAFREGPALVEAEGHLQAKDTLVEIQEWTRQVQIIDAPVVAARLTGTAHGLGRGPEEGGIAVTARLTVTAPLDLSSPLASVTITNLLNEIDGGGELVDGLPLRLGAEPGNASASARFSTPAGTLPVASLAIRARSDGELTLILKIAGATIGRPGHCSPTTLLTSVAVHDGINPPIVLPVVQPWNCATRGGNVEYLRTP